MKESTPVKETRARRSPVGARNRLSLKDQDPNFKYRIVNDEDDRVDQLIEQGYVIVEDAKVGAKRVDNAPAIGGRFSVGNGLKAVVMKQRKDWFDEDQRMKQSAIDEQEKDMNDAAKRGT